MGKSHDIDGVKVALKDPNKKVRQAAINSLSLDMPRRERQKDPDAIAIVIQALNDNDRDVRYAALYKLKDYGTEAFFLRHDTDPEICNVIIGLFRDPWEQIRFQAVTMCENCRTKESEDGLLKIADDRTELVRIRRVAIMMLGNSRTQGMAERIMPFLKQTEEKEIRTGAVYSLGKLKHSAAVPLIIPYVYDQDNQAR